MTPKHTQYSNGFRFKIALETVKGVKTVSQLAAEYNLHPTQISDWKKQLMQQGNTLFTRPNERQQREQQDQEAELYEQIGLNRSSYYQPASESPLNLSLMRLIDEQYLQTPFYGYLKMTEHLRQKKKVLVNHKRVYRLMNQMGLRAVAPGPAPVSRVSGTRFIPTCCEVSPSRLLIRFGVLILPMCPCSGALCIWWPSWAGIVAMSSVENSLTPKFRLSDTSPGYPGSIIHLNFPVSWS